MRRGDIAAFLVMLAGGVISSWLVDRILSPDRIRTADLAALSAKYRRWQLQSMSVWLLVLLPAASVGARQLLTRLAEARHAKLGRFEIAFFPGVIEWGFGCRPRGGDLDAPAMAGSPDLSRPTI